MSAPTASLTALRTSTAALLAGVDAQRWTDAEVRAPSLLPGWTRGHVLAHIARNADGITRTLSGALRGEIVARYPDGRQGRNADIEAGSTRGFAELAADVRESADRLDRLLGAVADADGWDLPTEDLPARDYVVARWREVEIHHVDLAGEYAAEHWPAEFVAYLLPQLADGLAQRATTALRIEVAEERSVTTDLSGRVWTAGTGDPVDVSGPDWALTAWLVGRPAAAAGTLNQTPDVAPWLL
ncbi:MAG: maleylpyruvate isomerase [Pseudonocardiales bacterium]|nr:MAG: maleylpyruvate isomerase [Pseudonocardiales bacterium]